MKAACNALFMHSCTIIMECLILGHIHVLGNIHNPLTLELNHSEQCCLPEFFPGDFKF